MHWPITSNIASGRNQGYTKDFVRHNVFSNGPVNRHSKHQFKCLTDFVIVVIFVIIRTEERVALRKQGLNERTAASVLLKLFISGNERCHTTDAP